MKKIVLLIIVSTIFLCSCQKKSPWEGRWEYGRYAPAYGGGLDISDCEDNKCHFSIFTFHGSHTCDVDGYIKILGTQAEYYNTDNEQDIKKITMKLNLAKENIEVDWISGHFCGIQGNIGGTYENKDAPLRYLTSFDCWRNELSSTEKTICLSEKLAKADIEFSTNYSKEKTEIWQKNRDKCYKNEECLWNFYVKSIRTEYEKSNDGKTNLFHYFKNQNPKWNFPTSYALLNEYFMQNMEQEDYDAWIVTLYDKSYTIECENCILKTYGITGLFKIYESAFYINKDEIWIVFVSANLSQSENKNIIVYAPYEKKITQIPEKLKEYIDYLSPYFPKGVKLKHFYQNNK